VVNERDLFALQRVSMRQVIEVLRGAESLEDWRGAPRTFRGLTRNLLAQGVGAEPLTRTIASLNDGLTRRAITSAPRVTSRRRRLCWLALGAKGAASRRSPPIRTMRSCSRRRIPASRRGAQAVDGIRRRDQRRACKLGFRCAAAA